MDMYFRQFWQDPRLSFEKRPNLDKLVVGAEYINQIWVPDTFFVNEKTAYFHKATTENQFLRILHTGETLRSIRYGKLKKSKIGSAEWNACILSCWNTSTTERPRDNLGGPIVRVCCLLFYPRDISPLECDVMFLCLLLLPAWWWRSDIPSHLLHWGMPEQKLLSGAREGGPRPPYNRKAIHARNTKGSTKVLWACGKALRVSDE